MNKGMKAGILLAGAVLFLAWGINETQKETVQEEPGIEEVAGNYVYSTEWFGGATEAQVKKLKDFVSGQSQEEDRVITRRTYIGISESEAREDVELLLDGFVILETGNYLVDEEGNYLVGTGSTVKTVKGNTEEIKDKSLYLGGAYIETHRKKIDGSEYVSVETSLAYPKALSKGAIETNSFLGSYYELEGLAGRVAEFGDKYGGKWFEDESAEYELTVSKEHTDYFNKLSSYLEGNVGLGRYKVKDNKIYIELDATNVSDFETFLEESDDVLGMQYVSNGSVNYIRYIIEFDLETKLFGVIKAYTEEEDMIEKTTLTIKQNGVKIDKLNAEDIVSDMDTYSEDYKVMIGKE